MIPIIKTRRSWDRLIFKMGFSTPIRWPQSLTVNHRFPCSWETSTNSQAMSRWYWSVRGTWHDLLCSRSNIVMYHDSKVRGANMGPIWGRQDPGGRHCWPMNLDIWVSPPFPTYLSNDALLTCVPRDLGTLQMAECKTVYLSCFAREL